MVTDKRSRELTDITQLESFISEQVKEEKESKELFNKKDVEVRTELSEEETSIIARLKFLCNHLELTELDKTLTYLMELRISKNRKSRKEFIDSVKRETNISGLLNGNLRGFNDDCITATAGALWLFENEFKQVESAKESAKSMLNAWLYDTAPRSKEPNKFSQPNPNNHFYQNGQDMSAFLWLLK